MSTEGRDVVLRLLDSGRAKQRSAAVEAAGEALASGSFADTDMANARRLAQRFGNDIRYTENAGFLVYDGVQWMPDEKDVRVQGLAKKAAEGIFDELRLTGADQQSELFKHARRSQSAKSIVAMVSLVRSEPGILASITDFDSDPYLFNVSNGTIDLRTGGLRPHSRADLITRSVRVAYDPAGSCPRWLAFLKKISGDSPDLPSYLQRVVGYLLTGSTAEQVLHFLYGLGANGKSVFCEIVADLLGEYAIIVSPELVMAKRHQGIPNDVARLRGARAALMNETSQGARFDEAKLKDLTGGDTLTGRFLHREFFDFVPTHKIMIRGNYRPSITGTDDGIWRRLRLVPFTVSIPAEEQDRHLLAKLREELPGILAWAVQGCIEWQRSGLRPPECVQEAVRDYRSESDTLGRFIEEECEIGRLCEVKSSVLQSRYTRFCEEAGERALPSKELPHEMRRRGFERKKTKVANLYLGLRMADSERPSWHD